MFEIWQTPSDQLFLVRVDQEEDEFEVWSAPLARNTTAEKDCLFLEGPDEAPASLEMDHPEDMPDNPDGTPFATLIATYKVAVHAMRDRNGNPFAFGKGLEYLGPIETPLVTAAEFRSIRDRVGVSMGWLAAYLGVQERTVHRWEAGTSMIPSGVKVEILSLNRRFRTRYVSGKDASVSDARFAAMVKVVAKTMQGHVLYTYRNDEDLIAIHPDAMFPSQAHRAACAQLLYDDPKVRIFYHGEVDSGREGSIPKAARSHSEAK